MADRLRYHWQWEFESEPAELWPLAADTNRFDRDTGLPAVSRLPGEPLPNGRVRAELRLLGQRAVWIEQPFEWIEPRGFTVTRRYDSGPLVLLRADARFEPRPGGGTRLDYRVEVEPRGLFGVAVAKVQVGRLAARTFAAAFRRYDQVVRDGRTILPPPTSDQPSLAPGAEERLAVAGAELADSDPVLLERLLDLLRHGDELCLERLRPYALAHAWDAEPAACVELCLRAVRAGLLRLRWDLLCPQCRGANERAESLADIPDQVHCVSCHIDYQVGFERSVELTFAPSETIRPLAVRTYCIGGPRHTPHIIAQQLLAAGEVRELPLRLQPGAYQLRLFSERGAAPVEVTEDGDAATTAVLDQSWRERELILAPESILTVRNETGAEQLVILERTAWRDDALTAAEVLRLQTFRDLFAAEALRPGQPITVGSQTVVFTDLRGSTVLYQTVGDAPAFGRVMSHFDLLREAVAAEGGAIVKTIGDAVMAVFGRPAAGLRALLSAQQALRASGLDLTLKAGLHHGPCIAVNLNDRLDYFGTTVNLASRLEGQSSGADVILSPAVLADPEVTELLAEGGVEVEEFDAVLRGFESERLRCGRVRG